MNIVNYHAYNTPASHHVLVDNFVDFAVSVGWTLDESRTDVRWYWVYPQYDWISGTERFAQLHSYGPGGSYIGLRLRTHTENNGAHNTRRITFGGFKSAEATYSHAAGTHPVNQGSAINFYAQVSSSDVSFLKQYMFGNAYFLHMIVQYSAVYSFQWFFGLPEFLLYPTGGDVMMDVRHFYNHAAYTAGLCSCDGTEYDWNESYITINSTNYTAYLLSRQFRSKYSLNYGQNFACLDYTPAILTNAFALARPIIRDGIVISDGGNVYRLIAYTPWAWTSPSGLQAWQELQYGSETFIACPISMDGINTSKKMLVYRIA